jgi:hypothetical protein
LIDGLPLSVATIHLGERRLITIRLDYGHGENGRDPLIHLSNLLELCNDDSTKLRVVLCRNLAVCCAKLRNWKKRLKNAGCVPSKSGDPPTLLRKADSLADSREC